MKHLNIHTNYKFKKQILNKLTLNTIECYNKNEWVFLHDGAWQEMKQKKRGYLRADKLGSWILEGAVENLKKLGLGFELNWRRRRRRGGGLKIGLLIFNSF